MDVVGAVVIGILFFLADLNKAPIKNALSNFDMEDVNLLF